MPSGRPLRLTGDAARDHQRAMKRAYYKRRHLREKEAGATGVALRGNITQGGGHRDPPPEVLAEAALVAAAPRELRHVAFGDPLPGRSALDHKRNLGHGG